MNQPPENDGEHQVIGYIRNGINDKLKDYFEKRKDKLKDKHSFQVKTAYFPHHGWSSFENATLLHVAVFYNNPSAVRYLLKHEEIDINAKTSAGVTSLHIACRLGNLLTLDLLLKGKADCQLEDEDGRIALHYAVMSDKFGAVLLLSKYSHTDFTKSDEDRKTPLDYADPRSNMRNLLCELADSEFNYYWAPAKLEMHACTNPIEKRRRRETRYCQCKQPIDLHGEEFRNLKLHSEWDSKTDMLKLPTNAFGEIEFSGLSQTAKFVRLSHETEEGVIKSLLQDHWDLPQPSIIICIYGNECNTVSLKSVISKGIWKTVGQSHAWIITNGINMDVVGMIGEAVRDYCDAYGGDAITSIGIVPWNLLRDRDALISDDYEGSYPAVYPVQKATFEEITLNPNCTHFIMEDANETPHFGCGYKFRAKVEKYATTWKVGSETESKIKSIPSCGMLIAGDRTTLQEVYTSVVGNGSPLVILKGTGGLADILSEAIDAAAKSSTDVTPKFVENSMVSNWLLNDDERPAEDEINHVIDIIREDYKIEVFVVGDTSSTDLDGKILSALLSSATEDDGDSSHLNIGQLKIALTLDRSDVAKSKVFSDQKRWKKKELDEPFFTALVDTKVGFVKLFIEQGFRLEKFVTPKLLEELYKEDLKSKTKMRILRTLYSKINQSKETMTLQKIGKVISILIDSFYKPLYLQEDFVESCAQFPENPVSRPARELYLWSLLTQRVEMASFFWTLQQDAMASGLFAAILLRQMSKVSGDVIELEDLTQNADHFEDRATGVLNECYDEDQTKAMESLRRELTHYGKTTCLILAAKGKSIKFIAHRCCMELLKNIWFGGLSKSTPYIMFCISVVIGIIPNPLVAYVMTFDEVSKEDTQRSHDAHPYTTVKGLNVKQACRTCCSSMWTRMKTFYSSPLIKFVYSTITYIAFLLLFSYTLLFQMVGDINACHYLHFVMFCGLVLEELRQAFKNGASFSSYIGDLWNKLDVLAIVLYIFGAVIYANIFNDVLFQNLMLGVPPVKVYSSDSGTLITISRFLLGISLFIFYTRLLQVLSVNINLGPKVIMIFRMISKDLVPFMIVFMIFVVAYGVLLYGVTFPMASPNFSQIVVQLYDMMRTSFFESFGDFRIEYLTQEAGACEENKNCPDVAGKWASLIFLGIYYLITNVLLLNMLIAMFSHTYESIQTMAIQYWAIQRYTIIREYTERSVCPPPLNILWICLKLPFKLYFQCVRGHQHGHGPFTRTFESNRLLERQLTQWERLRVLDYLRSLEDGHKKKKRSEPAVYVNRTSILSGNSVTVKKELSDVRDELGSTFRENFHQMETRLERLDAIDVQLVTIQNAIAELGQSLGQQLSIYKSLEQDRLRAQEQKMKGSPIKISQPPKLATQKEKEEEEEEEEEEGGEGEEGDHSPPQGSSDLVSEAYDSTSDHQSTVIYIEEAEDENTFVQPESQTTAQLIKPFLWTMSLENHVMSRLVPYSSGTTERSQTSIQDWRRIAQEYKPTYVAHSICHEVKWADQPTCEGFTFNGWDNMFKVNRKSLSRSQYRLQNGSPINPNGRQGIAGRGYLPFWGPNHTVHLIFTRWSRDEKDAILKRDGRMIIQSLALQVGRLIQLPWYFLNHKENCDFEKCVKTAVKEFLQTRAKELLEDAQIDRNTFDTLLQSWSKMEQNVIYQGFVDDYMNADNAWIETVALNCHELYTHHIPDALLRILTHADAEGEMKWFDVFNRRLMRDSHLRLLEEAASFHNAAFA